MKDGRSTCTEVVPRAIGVSAVLAVGVAVRAWSEPVSLELGPTGLWVDRSSLLVVLLVTGVGATVTSFARRSLRGEPYQERFFALAAVVTAASVVLATAATITLLTAAWLVVSAGVAGLVGLTGTPEARAAARKARRTLAVGDVALVVATALVVVAWGDVSLRGPLTVQGPGPLTVVGVLIVVAAATRSAQVPAHGWLIGTVWAPTPVSALLHAGVVNAGGILAIRLWGLVGAAAVVTHLLLLLGTLTLVVGTLQARARSDVKGSLAASTVAQMGFMTLTIAVGAHAGALLHLVAHGMFKASLFLGSGSAVSTARRARQHPRSDVGPSRGWRAAAVTVPVAMAGAVAVFEASYGILAADVLLATVLGAAAVAIAVSGLHRTRSAGLRLLVLVGAGSIGGAYLVLAHAVDAALGSDLPAAGTSVPGLAWLGAVAVAAGLTAAVVRRAGGQRVRSVQAALYGALVVPRITEGAPLAPAPPVPVSRASVTAATDPAARPAVLVEATVAHSSSQPLGAPS